MYRFREIMWLIIMLISVIAGTYNSIKSGIEEAYVFFIITLISGIFYFIARKDRIKFGSENKQ